MLQLLLSRYFSTVDSALVMNYQHLLFRCLHCLCCWCCLVIRWPLSKFDTSFKAAAFWACFSSDKTQRIIQIVPELLTQLVFSVTPAGSLDYDNFFSHWPTKINHNDHLGNKTEKWIKVEWLIYYTGKRKKRKRGEEERVKRIALRLAVGKVRLRAST